MATHPEPTTTSFSGERPRDAVRRMGRERLVRYVADLIKKQTTPLRDVIRDHALPYLPAQSLLRLRSVSAAWNRHISAPFFAHTQSFTHRTVSGLFYPDPHAGRPAYLPFDPKSAAVPDPSLDFIPEITHIVASSNGLIACQSAVPGRIPQFYVCNPATTRWTALPRSTATAIALVFHPSSLNFSADYYFVCTVSSLSKLMVFSSKTGTWRRSNAILHDDHFPSRPGVAVGGIAYWVAKGGDVIAYDPISDSSCVVGPPPAKTARWRMGEMGGKLCWVGAGEGVVEVYVLEHGRQPSWRKAMSAEVAGDVWPVVPVVFDGGEEAVVVWVEERVVVIERRSGATRVVAEEAPRCFADAVPYISSLVAVKELCSGEGYGKYSQHARIVQLLRDSQLVGGTKRGR